MYRDLIDNIKVYSGNTVEVYMKCLLFKLNYSSRGKLDKFTVNIEKMEIIN